MYIANVGGEEAGGEEISELPPAERKEFLEELGFGQSGLGRIVLAAYRLLGLITFLQGGQPEAQRLADSQGNQGPSRGRQDPLRYAEGFYPC